MKKYLTMVLAIAISGVFVGCHEEEIGGSLIEQKKIAFEEAFVKAFGQPDPTHNWGFRMPNEDITRSYNPNANIWGSTHGLDVPQVLTQKQKERVIAYFQNHQFITGGGSLPTTEFFVQQVYKGGEQNGQYVNIMKTNPALTTEKYQSLSMDNPGYGSDHMDRLYANNNPNDHMGNYNGGNMSWNNDVENTNTNIQYLNDNGNGTHRDQIQYMYDTYATGFGYHCSEPSIQYSDHYKLIDGNVIDAWATSEGQNIGESVSGRSFVGFDFDLLTPDQWYTTTVWKPSDIDPDIKYYTDANGKVHELSNEGYKDALGNYIYWLVNKPNMLSGTWLKNIHNLLDIQDYRINGDYKGKTFNKAKLDNYIAQGYRPMTNHDWAIPEIARDYYYSDWIVCIIPGNTGYRPAAPEVKTVNETSGGYYRIYQEVIESGRVMCEDLAGASGNLDDLDYNDVVFDAVIVHEYKKPTNAQGEPIGNAYDDAYFATVRLMAAGGTIPVTMKIGATEVNGQEVGGYTYNIHSELEDPTTGYIMMNTLPNTEEARKDVNMAQVMPAIPVTLTYTDDDGNVSDKFYGVEYISDIKLNVLYQNVSEELVNKYGAATLKFLTPLGTAWAKERKRIDYAYPGFPEWVADKTKEYVWLNDNVPNGPNTTYLYLENESEGIRAENLVGLNEADFNTISDVNQGSAGSYSKTTVTATSTMAYPSSSETVLFDFHPENATNATPGFLCPAVGSYSEEALSIRVLSSQYGDFVEGKTIRIYGVNYVPEGSEPDWYVSTNFTGNQKFTSFNANGNYIEIKLDADNINQIKSGITIQGKHFTVTYVTIASESATPTPTPEGGAKTGQFWPTSGNGSATSQFEISKDIMSAALTNKGANNKICIYCTVGPSSWIKLHRGDWENWTNNANNVPGWTVSGNEMASADNTLSSVFNSSKGCVEVPLTTLFITELSNYGFGIHFGEGMTVTNMTVE